MLNITALELSTFAEHFDAESAAGFDVPVTIAKGLIEGDNHLTQDNYYEVSGMVHRALERLEAAEVIDRDKYRTMNNFADKLDVYEESF